MWAGEFFNGRIDEVRVYNRALSAAEITTDMATPLGGDGTPPGDVTPPTVSLTAPANGTTVSGTVALSATASDAGGIAGVTFRVDGARDRQRGHDGALQRQLEHRRGHRRQPHADGRRRDGAGNVATSAAVTVTVANAGADPAVVGQWTAPLEWPLVPVHMMLMRNGRVMMFDGFADGPNSEPQWDPATNTFIAVPYARNLFCSLHVALADGRLAIFGGHINPYEGLADLSIYDPGTRHWRRGAGHGARPLVPDRDDARRRPRRSSSRATTSRLQRPASPVPLINASNTLPEIYNPSTDAWTPTAVGVALDAAVPVHVPAAERQGVRRRART